MSSKTSEVNVTQEAIEKAKAQNAVVLANAQRIMAAQHAEAKAAITHDETIGVAILAFVDSVKVIKAQSLYLAGGFKSFKEYCEETLPASSYWSYAQINDWTLAESVPLLREHFGFVGMDNLRSASIMLRGKVIDNVERGRIENAVKATKVAGRDIRQAARMSLRETIADVKKAHAASHGQDDATLPQTLAGCEKRITELSATRAKVDAELAELEARKAELQAKQDAAPANTNADTNADTIAKMKDMVADGVISQAVADVLLAALLK